LIPSLPKPSDLRPFPTALCVTYETPHEEDKSPIIRCLSVSPDGQFLVSGASDGFARLWEVQSGRLLRSWDISSLTEEYNKFKTQEGKSAGDDNDDEEMKKELEVNNVTNSNRRNILPVVAVEWNPNKSHHCLLAAVGSCAVVIATGTGGVEDAELTDALLAAAAAANGDNVKSAKAAQAVKWIAVTRKKPKKDSSQNLRNGDLAMHAVSALGGSFFGPICILKVNKEISNLKWHRRGDYFLTVAPKAGAASVLIHQLSKANSQQPFSKSKGGETQCACFHPNKPFLFVATQQQVRVYHLIKQEMVKKLISGCRWLSSLDVHPSGDHLLVGSLDRRVAWFDLDLSSTPYKTLKYHEKAVRSVSFHYRYPLFATSSDDGTVHVFHGMVYSDLMRNPLLVPCKVLRGHTVTNKLGVLASVFHPTQPWLFSAGADGKIILFQDI
jgi:ribosome biogenesis protein ERB1